MDISKDKTGFDATKLWQPENTGFQTLSLRV